MSPIKSEAVIWVLEDDPSAQFVYEEILGFRYKLHLFSSVAQFQTSLGAEDEPRPNLIVADLRLPDQSFLSFLESPQVAQIKGIPFIVVSSMDDLDALRYCFEKGAVDYITKPFGKGELIVKLERLLSEKTFTPIADLAPARELAVDLASLSVSHDGNSSPPLTAKELQILTILQRSLPNGTSRDEIMSQVWGAVKVDLKSLDVHLFNLRKKLSPIGIEIKSVGQGHYELLYNRVNR